MTADGTLLIYSNGRFRKARGPVGITSDLSPSEGQQWESTIETTGTPTGGSFTLDIIRDSVTVATTDPLGHDAGDADIQSAIIAALTLAGEDVPPMDSQGGNLPDPIVIIFTDSPPTNQWNLAVNADNLTGGTSPAVTAEQTGGHGVDDYPTGTMWTNWVLDRVYIQMGAPADPPTWQEIT